MKKLLFLLDTDAYPSVFDTVVAYDGGADRVAGYANVTPDTVGPWSTARSSPAAARTSRTPRSSSAAAT